MIVSTHSEDISVSCLKVKRVTDGDDPFTRETVVGDGEWEVSRGIEEVLKCEGKLSMGALVGGCACVTEGVCEGEKRIRVHVCEERRNACGGEWGVGEKEAYI